MLYDFANNLNETHLLLRSSLGFIIHPGEVLEVTNKHLSDASNHLIHLSQSEDSSKEHVGYNALYKYSPSLNVPTFGRVTVCK